MSAENSAKVVQNPYFGKLVADDIDNWSEVQDAKEKKRIQNRLAQRAYRTRLKQRLQRLDSLDKKILSLAVEAHISTPDLHRINRTWPSPAGEVVIVTDPDIQTQQSSEVHSTSFLEDPADTRLSTAAHVLTTDDNYNESNHGTSNSIQSEGSQFHAAASLHSFSSSIGSCSDPSTASPLSSSNTNMPTLMDIIDPALYPRDLSACPEKSSQAARVSSEDMTTAVYPSVSGGVHGQQCPEAPSSSLQPPLNRGDSQTTTTNTSPNQVECHGINLDSTSVNTIFNDKIGSSASPPPDGNWQQAGIANLQNWFQIDIHGHLDNNMPRTGREPTLISSTMAMAMAAAAVARATKEEEHNAEQTQTQTQINQQIPANFVSPGVKEPKEPSLPISGYPLENNTSSLRDPHRPIHPNLFTQSYSHLTAMTSTLKYLNREEKAVILEQLIRLSYIIITH